MHTFTLNVPAHAIPHPDQAPIRDFGLILDLARERAHTLDQVVYIHMDGAGQGCPNRWAVSPKGYLSVEGVQLPTCMGCGDY
jgi:hypothetical protein